METDTGIWKDGNPYFTETKYSVKLLLVMICEESCMFNERAASGKGLEDRCLEVCPLCKWPHLA